MAAVGQLWPVHLSVKVKMTVDETATFAAGLLLGPFYAMVATAASTLIALHFRGVRQRWYNRGFNTAASVLATGSAATVYLLLAGPGSIVVRAPWALLLAPLPNSAVHPVPPALLPPLHLPPTPPAPPSPLHPPP